MKARAAHSNNRRRPHWWSALLSLFVALSLVVPPSQLCALMETAPGHAHSDGHAHSGDAGHSHSDEGAAHHDDHHQPIAQHTDKATLQPVPHQHACCPESAPLPVVMAAPSRSATPDESAIGVSFMPATLPAMQNIFALTNCHGRDGPDDSQPLPQLSRASLLGRAPPVSV